MFSLWFSACAQNFSLPVVWRSMPRVCDDELAKTVGVLCPWPKPNKLQAFCHYFICSHQINMSRGGHLNGRPFLKADVKTNIRIHLTPIPVVSKPICFLQNSVSDTQNVLNVPENNLQFIKWDRCWLSEFIQWIILQLVSLSVFLNES